MKIFEEKKNNNQSQLSSTTQNKCRKTLNDGFKHNSEEEEDSE